MKGGSSSQNPTPPDFGQASPPRVPRVAARAALAVTAAVTRLRTLINARKLSGLVVTTFIFLSCVPGAGAISLPGEAYGPGTVHPGQIAHFHGLDLRPLENLHVSMKPLFCIGNRRCAAKIKGTWRTSSNGGVHVAVTIPRRYQLPCAHRRCVRHPLFTVGSRAWVQLCVNGVKDEAHYGYHCLVKTVRIAKPVRR